MVKWIIAAIALFAAYKFWRSRNQPFAGFTSVGWGGNWVGNQPALVNRGSVVASTPSPIHVYSPPGMPYGPSLDTNGGSGG